MPCAIMRSTRSLTSRSLSSSASHQMRWVRRSRRSGFSSASTRSRRRLQTTFVQAGGRADLKLFGPIPGDGHGLYANFNGRIQWLREFDKFLLANRLPNANVARVEQILQATRLSNNSRKALEEYLSAPLPKAYVFTPSGQPGSWSADTKGVNVARDNALAACRKGANGECTVTLLNNTLVRPVVTGANHSSAAAN